MSWRVVARKEFRDAIRSRWLWALTVVFVVFSAGAAGIYVLLNSQGQTELTSLGLVFFLLSPAGILVPVIGLVVSYKAVAGERESGSLKLLLGLPHTRLDVVLGKVVGRTAVTAVAVTVGFAVTAVVALLGFSEFSASTYLGFVALTMLLALTYISIGVGISSLVSTTSRALASAVVFFVVFELLWGVLVLLLHWLSTLVTGGSFDPVGYTQLDWTAFLLTLAPGTAFSRAISMFLPASPDEIATGGVSVGAGAGDAAAAGGSDPFFTAAWFGVVVLLAWIVVMLTLGYRRFNGADLG
jgi:ABC-2 type transport system permease protein